MKCMCAQTRPRFILSSEGVLGGMEFEPMLTPREKSPLKKSPEEDRTRDTVDSEPKHYQLSYSGPHRTMYPYIHSLLLSSYFRTVSVKRTSKNRRKRKEKKTGGKLRTKQRIMSPTYNDLSNRAVPRFI